MSDSVLEELRSLLKNTLRLGDRADHMTAATQLLGGLPEFDSMAVVSVVTALEEHYGFAFDDDEIRGESFETVGSLADLIRAKLDT